MDTIKRIKLNDWNISYSLEIVMKVAYRISWIFLGKVMIQSSLIESNQQESLNTMASMTDQDGNDLESDNIFFINFKDSNHKNIEPN